MNVQVETHKDTFEHKQLSDAIDHAKELSEERRGPVFLYDPNRNMQMSYQNGDLMTMTIDRKRNR